MTENNDDKVVEFVPKEQETVDPRSTMTREEIEAFMRQEQAELDAHLNKFLGLMPMPDTSDIAEDEEEEVVTLDFEDGKMTATEKVSEGVIARDPEGNISEIHDPAIVEMVKKAYAPTLKDRYQDMITDRFVSKAISNLISKFNAAERAAFRATTSTLPYGIGDKLGNEFTDMIIKQKRELTLAIANGKVHYDRIPEWAKAHIDEYVMTALGTLIDFVERD